MELVIVAIIALGAFVVLQKLRAKKKGNNVPGGGGGSSKNHNTNLK